MIRKRRALERLVMRCCCMALFSRGVPDAGAIVVSPLFSDGMVLQQGKDVPVWGRSDPGARIEISFAGQMAEGVAGEDGRWLVRMKPLASSSSPQLMTITSSGSSGTITHSIRDVLIGEVWLCSGQSNMGMNMVGIDRDKEEIPAATFPEIRLFNVRNIPAETPRESVQGDWVPCRPDQMHRYSAMAYFFGRRIHQETGVPVGLVVSAWGGSSVAAWMSREALDREPVAYNFSEEVIAVRINNRHSRLYNGMLHPLIPYAIAGAI